MPVNGDKSGMAVDVETTLNELITFQLFKSWNIFATRIFYFVASRQNQVGNGDYRLTLECPWRIEQGDRILVGSEDYWLRAEGNTDTNWNATDMQWGHLQDQLLERIMGEEKNGSIFNSGANLVVENVRADDLGGFQLGLSGGYVLSVFPSTGREMEWLFSRSAGGNLALTCGALSRSLTRSETQNDR